MLHLQEGRTNTPATLRQTCPLILDSDPALCFRVNCCSSEQCLQAEKKDLWPTEPEGCCEQTSHIDCLVKPLQGPKGGIGRLGLGMFGYLEAANHSKPGLTSRRRATGKTNGGRGFQPFRRNGAFGPCRTVVLKLFASDGKLSAIETQGFTDLQSGYRGNPLL